MWHTVTLLCKPLQTMLHEDRLFPAEPRIREIARTLYQRTRSLPIVSPHGHCDPAIFSADGSFPDPAFELISRDHYLLRLLYSQGVPYEALGVAPLDAGEHETEGRRVWKRLAENYHLFRGTPSKLWLDHTLAEVFGVTEDLTYETADHIYDHVVTCLAGEGFAPRALYEHFNLEFLATTDAALDPLDVHRQIRESDWKGRVVPTFRPDDVVDPDRKSFHRNIEKLGEITGQDTFTWSGYLRAIRQRREAFIEAGATATDHGHRSPFTADLSRREAEALFERIVHKKADPGDAEIFRGQMLVEMATLSLEDNLAMQLHTGAWRNHNTLLHERFGPDIGADLPTATQYIESLKPLLDRFGNERSLTIIVYTLDESAYSRELAPLAGLYPALRLGPPWWFHDSPEGIRRYYQHIAETAGFANTVGFNDDARSLLTIPARHDVARRLNAGYLAGLVAEHRITESEAVEIADDLAYHLTASRLSRGTVTPLVLVGLMGSGKSTVGQIVARQTQRVFVDVDRAILEKTGKTVKELWEVGGEPAYRSLESETVIEALQNPVSSVIAAPGGVVLDPAVRAALQTSLVVWLRTRPATLSRRVRPDDHRPILGSNPEHELEVMERARSAIYAAVSNAIVDTDDQSAEAVAHLVLEIVTDWPKAGRTPD